MQDTQRKQVLIIDANVSPALLQACARHGAATAVAATKAAALKKLETNRWNFVIVTNAPGSDLDLDACRQLKSVAQTQNPELPVMMLSEHDSSTAAMTAIREKFVDFATTPLTEDQARQILQTWIPNHKTQALAAIHGDTAVIGISDELTATMQMAKRIAATNAPLLICGESGTGKELLAQYVHEQSKRSDGPFVKVNCAALNESLLESELFGHEKGAFTGAQSTRKGRFERANGGTLLLDEITETPPAFQAQLLRVLEEQKLERLGAQGCITVNVRIISTTNRDIVEEVRQNRFRADLYYRLAGVRLLVPPLRERKNDISALIWHFVNEFAAESGRKIDKLDDVLVDVFKRYSWPGNVRQLRNVVRSCLILGTGTTLELANVSWLFEELSCDRSVAGSLSDMLGNMTLAEIEQQAIMATLEETNGNRTRAAQVLGISDRTIREKIKRYRKNEIVHATA